jgi:GNAT superfamily N-acetyltransferase
MALAFHPLTPDRWHDLATLFGPRGACGGCWCMWWKTPRSEWDRQKGGRNRAAFRRIILSGGEPGILAYDGAQPVAWCAVEPRENYPVLNRSRVLGAVDDKPVWSIACLFVLRGYRRKGLSTRLIRAAVKHAQARGARIVEAYPFELRSVQPDAWIWTGSASAYRKAGFVEAARRSPTRPILRKYLRKSPALKSPKK